MARVVNNESKQGAHATESFGEAASGTAQPHKVWVQCNAATGGTDDGMASMQEHDGGTDDMLFADR